MVRTDVMSEEARVRQAAVEAWQGLTTGGEPHSAKTLQRHRYATVIRLTDPATGDSVIGKLTGHAVSQREVLAYGIAARSVPSLRCHGTVPDGPKVWLFVEDAGDVPYRPRLASDRRRASRWLAQLHAGAADDASLTLLDDRGPDWLRGHMTAGRQRIVEHLRAGPGACGRTEILRDLLGTFEDLDRRWSEVEALCGTFPPTLVHADVVRKNARMVGDGPHVMFRLFDWETSGRGPALIDLHAVDVASYAGAGCGARRLAHLSVARHVSVVLRQILSVAWETEWLGRAESLETIANLDAYRHRLRDGLGALGW